MSIIQLLISIVFDTGEIGESVTLLHNLPDRGRWYHHDNRTLLVLRNLVALAIRERIPLQIMIASADAITKLGTTSTNIGQTLSDCDIMTQDTTSLHSSALHSNHIRDYDYL